MGIEFKEKIGIWILLAILGFVVIFCLINLTSRPNLWFDEGINIELARSLLLFGKLDIMTAPGVFSGVPFVVGTNGYPLILPLAGVFDFFGFGFEQARLYMLAWIIIALLSIYCLVRKFFGDRNALVSAALVATFAPFYGNGLTVFGEIPGFVFLLWGLYFLARENPDYLMTGLLFGLASVTKPSLYLLLFPAFLVFLLFRDRIGFAKKIIKVGLGAVGPILLWIYFAFPNPFSAGTWQEALLFYRYPFGRDFMISDYLFKNLFSVFTHSTLMYFLLLTLIIVFWFFKEGRRNSTGGKMTVFFFSYAVFAFLYFLKSPFWLRYLMGFELLAFVFLPPALEFITKRKWIFYGVVCFFLVVQLVQLFFFRSDFYSTLPQETAAFVNEQLAEDENYKVGFLNLPEVAGFIDPQKKFHLVKVGGPGPVLGENPLSFEKESLPQFISFEKTNIYVEEYKDVLGDNYLLLKEFGSYKVYGLK